MSRFFLTIRTSALLNGHQKLLVLMLGRFGQKRGSERVVARVREYAIGRSTVVNLSLDLKI